MTTEPTKVCEKCGGTGKLFVDDMTHRMCICLYNRKMRVHLGPELTSAKPVFDSPLYQQVFDPVQGNLPTVDLTGKNLFIKAWWNELVGHLTWAFYCHGPNWCFQIVTDERIRNVYVGNEQYGAKSRKKRDDVDSNNSLHDLIGGEDFSLVVIRLGFLGYKNIAMAGALLEALRIREVHLKPTWIVEEPNSIFGPGHFSYSEELADYIVSRFTTIDLVKDKTRVADPRGVSWAPVPLASDEAGMSLDDERPKVPLDRPKSAPEPRFKAPETTSDTEMDSVLGLGPSRKKYSYGKKRNSGGGPV
jgi:hypothetical protein